MEAWEASIDLGEALANMSGRQRYAERAQVDPNETIMQAAFWARSERDEKREAARRLGVAVELRFLDAPYEELVRRVLERHAAGGIAITERHMERYRGIFEPPTDDELALYDRPLTRGSDPSIRPADPASVDS